MKCPKCGYNSFEIHDTCKKCANDLTSYKDIHGLKSIVLPHEARAVMAEKFMVEKVADVPANVADASVDMFSFDVPGGETAAGSGAFPKDDPFNFGDEPSSSPFGEGGFSFGDGQGTAQAKAEEDAFADLLESTSQNKGEPELSNFSWDDTPETGAGDAATKAKDDFNNLFGDTDDSVKK
jgi:hypothetical protein